MPQSLSQLYVHLIFSTKRREPMLLSPVREDLHAYLAAVLNNQDSESRRHERPRSRAVSIVEEPRAGKDRGGSEDYTQRHKSLRIQL